MITSDSKLTSAGIFSIPPRAALADEVNRRERLTGR
jgi:hypothetical protein